MSAVMGYAVRGNIHDSLRVNLKTSIDNFHPYNDNYGISKLQRTFECCEIITGSKPLTFGEWQAKNTSFINWANTEAPNHKCNCEPPFYGVPEPEAVRNGTCFCVHVPAGCCKPVDGIPADISCGINVDSDSFEEKLWTDQCWTKLTSSVLNQLIIVAGVAILIAMLEVITMLFGFKFWQRIRAKSYQSMNGQT